MKTIVLNHGQQVKVLEVPTPRAFGNYAVVQIKSAPMCTEYRSYEKGSTCVNMGHEAAGIVVDALPGAAVKNGDRVIVMPQYPCGSCDLCLAGDYIHCENTVDLLQLQDIEYGTGTFADHIIKPDFLLIPIPDDISYELASMACCGLGPALGAGKAMHIGSGDTVLITGAGPVGLGAVIYCVQQGATAIVATRNKYRGQLATELGAECLGLSISPQDVQKQFKVDKAIECSGNQVYQRLAIDLVKRKGEIAFIGEAGNFCFDLSRDLLRKGLTLHGIWHWNIRYANDMLALIRASQQQLKRLITHEFPLEKAEEAFQLQISGKCGKVLLKP